jgi:hypothetical protein
MKELYFNGSRARSVWSRLTRQTDDRENPADDFASCRTINEQPEREGIISMTLFGKGEGERFWKGLVEPILASAEKIKEILPGWIIRVYISSSLPQKVSDALVAAGCELVVMNPNSKHPYNGLLWRFLAASESVPFVVCDADMRLSDDSPTLNDLRHIPTWLRSDKTFFRRKSFPTNILWPICAGGWGGRPKKNGEPVIPDIKDRLERYNHDWFGCDEAFLTKEVWPLFKKEGYYTSYSLSEKITWVPLALLVVLIIVIVIAKLRHGRRK